MNDTDRTDRRRELQEFANAGAQANQPMPSGHALVRPTASLTPIGAQPVAMYRDEARVLQKLAANAAAAGADWFYRYPVRNQDGSQAWIEGPSIKLANDVARVFGNCVIEVREVDVGDAFTFYARFSDLETGFSMERAYRQRKVQVSMKTKDIQRTLDISYQIGQSKAIRNVICNSLQIYCDYAFEEARNSLVDKIGKNLEKWRADTLTSIKNLPCDLARVEAFIGKSSKLWLAHDIARIVAMGRAITDGMASLEESFPPLAAAEKAPPSPPPPAEPHGEAAPASPAVAAEEPVGDRSGSEATPPAASKNAIVKNFSEYMLLVASICDAALTADELMKWFRSEPQRRLRNACGLVAEETMQAKALVEARVKDLQQQT